jgi:transcriptional regulator GlxA family with amidase domain
MERKQVGIVVYEDVEVLDFCGPFEVFSVTRLNEEKRREESSPFNAFLVSETKSPVVATGGMKVVPDHDLDSCPKLDILLVPGGWGFRHQMNNERLLKWIADRSRQVETLTSVCTGALLNRHVAEARDPVLRRSRGEGNGKTHGIPVPRNR